MAHETEKHCLVMNNGRSLPLLGLGTWQASGDDVKKAVTAALECGYRHIDTAQGYLNEAEVGEAVQEFLQRTKTPRDDIFITTKVAPTSMAPENIKLGCQNSLKKLRLDVIDLFLLHTPICMKLMDIDFPVSFGPDGKFLYENHDFEEVWKAMENLVDEGLVRSIGVANFNSEQITRILKNCRIKPVTNQIECHAYFPQNEFQDFLKERDIFIMPYSTFTSPARPKQMPRPKGIVPLLENSVIKKLAEKYKKTPAQIVLRHALERGMPVIPKSVTLERIRENSKIFDFTLNQEDMREIAGIKNGIRLLCGEEWVTPEYREYPFAAPF